MTKYANIIINYHSYIIYDYCCTILLLILLEELIREIKNDIAIAERKLEEPTVNKFKNDDFLIINEANDWWLWKMPSSSANF